MLSLISHTIGLEEAKREEKKKGKKKSNTETSFSHLVSTEGFLSHPTKKLSLVKVLDETLFVILNCLRESENITKLKAPITVFLI